MPNLKVKSCFEIKEKAVEVSLASVYSMVKRSHKKFELLIELYPASSCLLLVKKRDLESLKKEASFKFFFGS